MMTRSLKRRLVKARLTLSHTIQKILEINQTRKQLPFFKNPEGKEKNLSEELRVLNKIAAQQARLIRHYENTLSGGEYVKGKVG